MHADFHVGDGVPGRMHGVEILDRHELEEKVVIGNKAEKLIAGIFTGDEALGGGIRFQKMHGGIADDRSEERTIRLELGAAVNHQAQLRPNVGDAFTAGSLFEAIE